MGAEIGVRKQGYYGGPAPSNTGVTGNYPVQTAAPPPPAVPITLTTQQDPALSAVTGYASTQMQGTDPLLEEAAQNYRNRMATDTTQRAIGVANSAADDSLASAMQRAKEEASISGTSSGSQIQRSNSMTDENERLKARQSADISLQRERDLDALAGGFASTAGMSAGNRLGWGSLAGSSAAAGAANQNAAQNTQLSAAQLAMQQQQAQQQAMLNAYNLAYS